MKVACIGGGPAGLYLALLLKRSDPRHEVRILERNPVGATFGWGVVFSEETLGALRDADPVTYEEITDTFARWGAIDIHYRGETVRSRGHVFSAIARVRLLDILARRCRSLGVEVKYETEVPDPRALAADHDLVVGADGVRSVVREAFADTFQPNLDVHRTRYIWFGTDRSFDAFTFIFRENDAGLFQVHAYPFDERMSTFIVECPEDTWRSAGLDAATEEESIAYCQDLFAEDLGGHRLLSNRSAWINFVTLTCASWHAGNVVLAGDAAHTAHFTIGSGTKLAMEDSIALAAALERRERLSDALVEYEMERQPVVERFQEAARESATYFENVRRYARFEPLRFAFNLLTRSGRITHVELTRRDAAFVAAVDSAVAGDASLVPPPPRLAPLRLRGLTLPNRVAIVDDRAVGVGLTVTSFTAVAADGRVSASTPTLSSDADERGWRSRLAHRTGPVCLRLGHAGRRGATRPRDEGADLPLRDGAWPLIAPSPLPYMEGAAVPQEMDAEAIDRVVAAFAAATERAARCGFDVLMLDAGHGYLLGSFLSPLSNRRSDAYGGSPAARARLPLEVLRAVRDEWPDDRPLAVRLGVDDWHADGLTLDEGVAVATMLRDAGCDLIEVVAGQSVADDHPRYGRLYLVPLADRVRNEAQIPVMVGGSITTFDEVDTVVAAGRADVCVLDPRLYPMER